MRVNFTHPLKRAQSEIEKHSCHKAIGILAGEVPPNCSRIQRLNGFRQFASKLQGLDRASEHVPEWLLFQVPNQWSASDGAKR